MKAFLVVALVFMTVAFGLEIGDEWIREQIAADSPPGLGMPLLAALDGLLLMRIGLTALGALVSGTLQGKVDGVLTLIAGIILIIVSTLGLIAAISLLALMLGMLMAIPFGTAIYLGLFGSFDRGTAAILLSFGMFCKLVALLFFVAWSFRVLKSKGLVLLALSSLLGTAVISFLHGFPPGPFVSITDAIAAIIVAILLVIWGIVSAVAGAMGTLRAIMSLTDT